jgi:hypothetical protein
VKATIDASGFLLIQAETELEAYALRKWCETPPGEDEARLRLLSWNLKDPIIPIAEPK